MRLTLRTLLAYLDDVLDPADKEELARKIESSDFAKDLVHQTRDSVRRLRLSAPQLIGTGMGMDPNSVAEYLDNALPPEQVGDYERICLESDVHLAETAACHHVLTMVLGEPAEVEPRSRQRMYMIPAEARERRRLRSEPAHSRAASIAAASPSSPNASVSPAVARGQAPPTNAFEVPEYLRAGASSRWRTFLVALAAMLFLGVAAYFVADRMGWFGAPSEVAAIDADAQTLPKLADTQSDTGVATRETTPAPTAPSSSEPAGETSSPPTVGAEPATAPLNAASPPPLASPPQLVVPEIGPAQSEATSEPASASDAASAVAGAAEPNAAQPPAAPPATIAPPTETPHAATATTDASETPVANESAPGTEPSAAGPPQVAATPDSAVTTLPPTSPDAPSADEAPSADSQPNSLAAAPGAAPPEATPSAVEPGSEEAADAAAGPPVVGTYVSGKTVLLRYDASNGGWFRVEPRSAIVAGDRLLSLPEFRPQITLASGVMLDVSGGTQVVITASGEAGPTGPAAEKSAAQNIEVLYGRIVLTNTSTSDSRVAIKAGANAGQAELARNATLAVEVNRPYLPGNDPRTSPAPAVATIFAPSGGVTWTDAAGEVAVQKPSRWTLVEGAPQQVVDDAQPPEWIDREPVVHLSEQRYGAPIIEDALVSDRPVDIQLLELFKGRDRREVKSLVARSSIHVGLFAPFIDALRDPEQRWPTWRSHIETMRTAMAQSPEAAEMVFKALVDQRGRPAAADLYEMLSGFSEEHVGTTPEAVKTGAIAKLIDWLEEDSLDYRVLAVHDLWEITGKQLLPNPAANAAVRKRAVSRWRDQLASNELQLVKREEPDSKTGKEE